MTIVTGDIHLVEGSEENVKATFQELVRACRKHADDHVVLNGDVFTERHSMPAPLLSLFVEMVLTLTQEAIEVDIVVGNHDQWNRDGRHVLEAFGMWPQVHVHTHRGTRGPFAFLPWYFGNESVEEALATLDGAEILFAHLGVTGAWMNNLKQDTNGFPIDKLRGRFKHVFLNHYHKPHEVEPGIHNVGSPYQVDYSEAGQEKRFMQVMRAQRAGWIVKSIPVDIGARHHKVTIDADHPGSFTKPDVRPGDKLWVVAKGQAAGVMESEIKRALFATGLDVARYDVDLQPEEKAARLEVSAEDSVSSLAERYLDAQSMDPALKALLANTLRSNPP
jgi:DNA repair exonuclease SbcCD nuclease subunit